MSEPGFRLSVGDITCLPLSDGGSGYPREWVFAGAPAEERDRALRERGIEGDVPSVYTCLLVDTGRNRVLVDTGMGPGLPTTGKLLESLRAAGYAPEDVDTVLLTHGHPDHIGGNVDAEGRPAFPNARYVMWEDEWDFWTSEANLARMDRGEIYRLGELEGMMAAFARNNLLPLRDRIDLVNRPGEVVPGISVTPAPGHTLHHLALRIASGAEQLLCPVDVAINPLHIERPDWSPVFDQEPEQARETRYRLLAQAAAEDALVFVYHYPFPGLGRVTENGSGWRWEPVGAPAAARP